MEAPMPDAKSCPVIVLNACPERGLRELRARLLNQAGYYTSSASSPEEAISSALYLDCAVTLICDSFSSDERHFMSTRIRSILPATKLLLLKPQDRIDPQIVISSIGDLLRETVALDPGEVPSRHQELLLLRFETHPLAPRLVGRCRRSHRK
jgi:hypothetical protein